MVMESVRNGESSIFPSQVKSCKPDLDAMSLLTDPDICMYMAARFSASAAFSLGSGSASNIFAKCCCDHAELSPCADITAISAREATMCLSSPASSLRETGSNVCLGQLVIAPINDCSACSTALSGRFSTKFNADVQSTRPLDIIETAGVCPVRTKSLSIRAPSFQKPRAIFLSMGNTTSAAVERTRNLSCGSDSGNATAIFTLSITNFCSCVSLAGVAGKLTQEAKFVKIGREHV